MLRRQAQTAKPAEALTFRIVRLGFQLHGFDDADVLARVWSARCSADVKLRLKRQCTHAPGSSAGMSVPFALTVAERFRSLVMLAYLGSSQPLRCGGEANCLHSILGKAYALVALALVVQPLLCSI